MRTIFALGAFVGCAGVIWLALALRSEPATRATIVDGPAYKPQTVAQPKSARRTSAPSISSSNNANVGTPQLGDQFSKLGLKTLFAIQSDSEKQTELSDDLHAEMDINAHPVEAVMFANISTYSLFHTGLKMQKQSLFYEAQAKCYKDGINGNKPGFGCENVYEIYGALKDNADYNKLLARDARCTGGLEEAFRKRIAIPLPDSCK